VAGVIALDGVSARFAGSPLTGVSLAWGPGVHSVVGGPGDGGTCLLALLAGLAKPRSGSVRVLDGDPRDPLVRRRVAHVPLGVTLPDGLRAGEVLDLAGLIRCEPARPASERLAVLGVESLAARPVRALSSGEARAVALAEALTSNASALLVEEPFVSLDPRASSRLAEALRTRAREGAMVLVATASVRDAAELGDDHTLLRSGAVAGQAGSLETLAEFSPSGARVRILTNDPAGLAAALAREAAVEAVARKEGAVVARGRDAAALAQAATRAIVESGVAVTQLRFEAPSL
jgi:ABC-2 type transport system ATP-binding protein